MTWLGRDSVTWCQACLTAGLMQLRLAVVAHSSSEAQFPSIPSIAGGRPFGEGGAWGSLRSGELPALGQCASPDFQASRNLSLECLLAHAIIPPSLQLTTQCTPFTSS